jgi:hypothetical protein
LCYSVIFMDNLTGMGIFFYHNYFYQISENKFTYQYLM